MARRKTRQTNYQRLDRSVAAMARRDDKLRRLIEASVYVDNRRHIRASILAEVLGYETATSFKRCIDNAQITAANTGISIETNFIKSTVFDGEESDLFLSEWAAYATVMEADTKLPNVSLAKSLFAAIVISERKQEEARLKERQMAKRLHRSLHGAADQAGVKTPKDHAVFDDHGYRGMYNMSIGEVEKAKGVPDGKKLIDVADYTELSANNLRMSMTADRILDRQIQTKAGANSAHFDVGRVVRTAVIDGSGRKPEELPIAEEDINVLTTRKSKEMKELEV